jgi:hypothetical protein
MKFRSLLLVLLMAMSSSIFAQSTTTVDVFLNGTKSGQYMIRKDQTEGGISYKKKDYRNLNKLSIQVSGKVVKGGGYIRTVEVNNDADEVIYTAKETPGVTGQFILSGRDKAVVKRLTKGNSVKLYLVKTPGNTKSREEVKKTYIGTLSRS